MKKKLIIIGSVIAVLLLFCTFVMPHIILLVDKQEPVAEEYAYSDVFYNEYDEVRAHLLDKVEELKTLGHNPTLQSHGINEEDGLYIDTIYVPSKGEQTNLIVITTGVHGIEGYIGSVMLDVFWDEVYTELKQDNTGVLVVANVNPYGMKYHRRYNENNVDLNRNFILDWESHDMTVNKDYPKCDEFLGPQSTMNNIFCQKQNYSHQAGSSCGDVPKIASVGFWHFLMVHSLQNLLFTVRRHGNFRKSGIDAFFHSDSS